MVNTIQKKQQDDEMSLVYGVYTKLIEGIKHFDSLQTIYRTMTSTLLLAVFVAIGFLFSSNGKDLPFSNLYAVIVVCAFAILAITAIGFLDLIFQERLVVANFVEAVKLERKYKWLPSIHQNMMYKGTHHGSPTRKALFYIGCSGSLILIIGVSIISLMDIQSHMGLAVSFVTIIIALSLYGLLFSTITGKFDKLVENILKEKVDKKS